MTGSTHASPLAYSEPDLMAGFRIGRLMGRQRVGGVWVDRQPPAHFTVVRRHSWVEGYLRGLQERALHGGDTPYHAGHAGFLSGLWRSENPYPKGTGRYENWLCGWLDAQRAAKLAKRVATLARSLGRACS